MNRMDPLAVLLRCPVSVRIVVMICMVVIGLTPSAAARADDLSCPKTTHAIQVDGALDEWEGALTSLESGKLSAAMRHDDRYLYLAIAISDPVYQRQVLGQGLFVYLDVQGGKERDFGVHFPLGLSEMGLRPDRAADREDEGPPDPERMQMRGPDPSALQQLYDGVASELEVIDGPYSSHRLRVDATPGVRVVERYANAVLTYELRVPLRESDDEPYAVGIQDTKK
ncbi:MAG: hypothetical protein KC729_16585, partial [Candidatus Eisenbacteria bacterium]|nr:hypothetical protein [Candidatus Eisenbacteria bacterium]